jgi:hypothetical protein
MDTRRGSLLRKKTGLNFWTFCCFVVIIMNVLFCIVLNHYRYDLSSQSNLRRWLLTTTSRILDSFEKQRGPCCPRLVPFILYVSYRAIMKKASNRIHEMVESLNCHALRFDGFGCVFDVVLYKSRKVLSF